MPSRDGAPRALPGPTWLAAGLLWAVGLSLFALGSRTSPDGPLSPAAAAADVVRAAGAPLEPPASGAPGGADGVAAVDADPGPRDADGAPDEAPIEPAGGAPAEPPIEPAAMAPQPAVAAAPAEEGADGPAAPPGDAPLEAVAPPSEPLPEPIAPEPTAEPPTPTIPTEPPATATPGPPPLAAEAPTAPRIDAALQARLRAIWDDGQARGRRPDVFAKVGDSLTVSGFFLTGLGCDTSRLGAREDLRPILDLYRAAEVPAGASVAPCAVANSLTRRPVSAGTGWLAAQVLAPLRGDVPPECAPPNETALRCEVALLQPSVAIVTLGTNDVHTNNGAERFGAALGRVVDELAALGVIPLVSTIPPRTDRPALAERTNRYNDAIVGLAAERQVPLVNLWRELSAEGLVRGGMEPDGIHLSAVGYGASLSEGGLRYGQNRRNALVLEALAKLRRVVVEGGAADG